MIIVFGAEILFWYDQLPLARVRPMTSALDTPTNLDDNKFLFAYRTPSIILLLKRNIVRNFLSNKCFVWHLNAYFLFAFLLQRENKQFEAVSLY